MKKTPRTRVPQMRKHSTGQAYVELNGQRIYLGAHDAPDTKERYQCTIAEWLSNGCKLRPTPDQITVVELCAAYMQWAQEHYGADNPSLYLPRRVIRSLKDLYGTTPAASFGPVKLRALRQTWIDSGASRVTVNDYVGEAKRIFKHGVTFELLPLDLYHGLATVEGLRAGRTTARECAPVKPVDIKAVEAIEPFVSRQVWALVQIQLLTAARGGELLTLRKRDIDTSGAVWVAEIIEHKTQYKGHTRRLCFGPKAQEILKPFLFRSGDAYLFSPKEAEKERRAAIHDKRVTPLTYGNAPGTNCKAKPECEPGEHYTTNSYRNAVKVGCKKAGIPVWNPHQLRHTAATMIRKEYGLEAAQVCLGHKSAAITQVYAEVDHAKALQVFAQIG